MTIEDFDHTRYRDEVEQRWGKQAYADSDRWWQGIGEDGRRDFMERSGALARDWKQAYAQGLDVGSEEVRAIARRHHAWVAEGWGGKDVPPEALAGLGQMYVADERFAATYGGVECAAYVRDALTTYAGTLTEAQP